MFYYRNWKQTFYTTSKITTETNSGKNEILLLSIYFLQLKKKKKNQLNITNTILHTGTNKTHKTKTDYKIPLLKQ